MELKEIIKENLMSLQSDWKDLIFFKEFLVTQ